MARLKPTYTQNCDYCHGEFVPRKRGTQRFCCNSCRTTHARKKKAGTLGKFTKLPGPDKGLKAAPPSFSDMALASATGALAANAVSQTTEYFAVTRGLVKQVEQLTKLVQQLAVDQTANAQKLGRGTLTLLTKLGATKEEAWKAINTPFLALGPTPVYHAPSLAQLDEILLAPMASADIIPPINLFAENLNTNT